ncbi:MAG: hypothetical protein Q7T87_11000 [Polaromonas sp.]|nr:hypothetical protein [Polaromonas sp.]
MKLLSCLVTSVLLHGASHAQVNSKLRGPLPFPTKMIDAIGNFGPGCRVRLKIPDGARYHFSYGNQTRGGGVGIEIEDGWNNGPLMFELRRALPWYMNLRCMSSDDEWVNGDGVAPLVPGFRWRADYSSEQNQELNKKGALGFDRLSTNTANGWIAWTDDTTNDESTRRRRVYYCLVKPPKALCGETVAGYLKAIRLIQKADLMPHILTILRSIEFLEDAPPVIPEVTSLPTPPEPGG